MARKISTPLPKNYIHISWSADYCESYHRLNPERPIYLLRYHWNVVFDLHGKSARVGPGGTTSYRSTPNLPTEKYVREMVLSYASDPSANAWRRNTVAHRLRKLCPLSPDEISSLPIVITRSSHKWPGWKPIQPSHPLYGVKTLELSTKETV